ncbi:MAG: MerR family transcriptional regulator [Chloroflexi bacterium]|nr:MerR family transcriptional regulator [Chloroflexota bacterium]
MSSIIELPDDPKYRIKAVSSKTGIRPVTLRAWERRHEILEPHRADNQYRLYSDRDIAILRWIKSRVDRGIPISSAVAELKSMQRIGSWPDVLPQSPLAQRQKENSVPPEFYSTHLFDALIAHEEERVNELFDEIIKSFDLNSLLHDIICPTLVQIGEAWYHGRIRISTEHYASNIIQGKLLNLMDTFPTNRSAPLILVGSGPDERHEIGSLMLGLLLRSSGFRVEYLGADLPLEDLVEYAAYEKPRMIILSATLKETAIRLKPMQSLLKRIRPKVYFGYGGSAFNEHPELQQEVPGIFLGNSMQLAVENVLKLFDIKLKEAQPA